MTNDDMTRRSFVGIAAAGLAAGTVTTNAQQQVVEKNVDIKTPDGTCDAAFIHPATGAHAAVIIWPDAFGLRQSMRDMGKRLAAENGYSVLVVNPYYRVAKGTVYPNAATVDFNAERDKLTPLMGSINAAGTVEKDAPAFVAWLDSQPQVDKTKKIGTQGYCMGGPIAFRTAAAVPDRVGAVATFHGGGLVTAAPNSPHLQAAKTKAQFLIAIAENDDMRSPNDKNILKETFASAKLPAEIEVYAAAHGWCPPDSQVYNEPLAEKAWSRLLALYGKALA